MATNGNAIATVGDIRTNFGVTLTSNDNYCPTYSSITANTSLGVSGATYSSNQLVMYKHIYKKATETILTLTVTDWKEFIEDLGKEGNEGIWMFSKENSYNNILDGSYNSNYPTSNLSYYDTEPTERECQIKGTAEQWQSFYESVDGEWDNLGLKNDDTGSFISYIPNWETLNDVVYNELWEGVDAEIEFMSNGSGGGTTTTGTCTIPIYWIEYNQYDGSEIDCYPKITIQSNDGTTYTQSYRVVGGYNNGGNEGEYNYIGEIDITYTGTSFNSSVSVNVNFIEGEDTCESQTTISLKERYNNITSKLSGTYSWNDDVFGGNSASFNNQWWALSDSARTASDYMLVLAFNW